MCSNLIPIKDRKVRGYKVVLEKNERQYSAAMGIRYHSGKLVKIPKKQIRPLATFNQGILNPKAGAGFVREMVGRTAAFINLGDARRQVETLSNYIEGTGYKVCVYLVELSNGLMRGRYAPDEPVYAGRRMTFLKSVNAQLALKMANCKLTTNQKCGMMVYHNGKGGAA